MRLSVIVPVHNGEKHIEDCLRSIGRQDFGDLEIIVVDDGSTDKTAALVERISGNLAYKTRLIGQDHRGAAAARLAGAKASLSEWIGFVDADDIIDRDYYDNLMHAAEKNDADVICCGIIEESGKRRKVVGGSAAGVMSGDEAVSAMLRREAVYAYPVNKVYQRELFENIGAAEGSMIGEDFDLMLSLLYKAGRVEVVPGNGYHYMRRAGSVTLRSFGPEKKAGYRNFKRIYRSFAGRPGDRDAMARYLMVEYVSCLLQMYRSKIRDREMEAEILDFVRNHRIDYIMNSPDRPAAKILISVLTPLMSNILYMLWPQIYSNEEASINE